MRELFVYYKVRRERATRACSAVVALQDTLRRQWPPLSARLLRRDDGPSDDSETWMEHYAFDRQTAAESPAGVTLEMQASIERQAEALGALIDGPRHVEAFVAHP